MLKVHPLEQGVGSPSTEPFLIRSLEVMMGECWRTGLEFRTRKGAGGKDFLRDSCLGVLEER